LITNPAAVMPQQIPTPEEVEYPLRGAAVRWWSVPPDTRQRDFLEIVGRSVK
jgi:hypothetical protein